MAHESESENDKSKAYKGFGYVLAGLIFLASLVAGTIPSEEKSKHDTDDANNEIAKWTRVVGRWTRGLVIIGVITAAVLFLQTFAFIQSERAAVVPIKVSLLPAQITAGKPLIWQMWIQNSGKEIAFITDGQVTYRELAALPKIPDYSPHIPGIHAVIPPADTFSSTYQPLTGNNEPIIINPPAVAEITNGPQHLWIYGYIAYSDGFSWLLGDRTLGFCFVYNPHDDPTNGMFDSCGQGAENYYYLK